MEGNKRSKNFSKKSWVCSNFSMAYKEGRWQKWFKAKFRCRPKFGKRNPLRRDEQEASLGNEFIDHDDITTELELLQLWDDK